MKTISRQRFGVRIGAGLTVRIGAGLSVRVGAGLTARPGARGQAPAYEAYDASVSSGCLALKNHGKSVELIHANQIPSPSQQRALSNRRSLTP